MSASIGGLIIIFVCAWWFVFYLLLPIKNKHPEKIEKGHASSAPDKHFIPVKLIITTLLAIALTYLYAYLVKEGILSANMLKPKDFPY